MNECDVVDSQLAAFIFIMILYNDELYSREQYVYADNRTDPSWRAFISVLL